MDISVIVPFYNGNAYMEQLFRVVRQNVANVPRLAVELLIVNDSPACAVEYDPSWIQGFSLRILPNERNIGIHGSRIHGVREAKGSYILMLDQDDRLADNALLSQYCAIGKSDVVVANGYDESDTNRGDIYKSLAQQRLSLQERYYYSVGNQIVSPGQCLIRKDSIPELWMQSCLDNNGSDDLLLWLLMLEAQCSWAVNPEMLYVHVNTGINVSLDLQKMKKSSYEVLEILKSHDLVTAEQERKFVRRFEMREWYEGKAQHRKIAAMLWYPDIAAELVKMKILGSAPFQRNRS